MKYGTVLLSDAECSCECYASGKRPANSYVVTAGFSKVPDYRRFLLQECQTLWGQTAFKSYPVLLMYTFTEWMCILLLYDL